MKILRLTLKKKWFDMIASGEKLEEYREVKPHWMKRFIEVKAPEERKGENRHIFEDMLFDKINNLGKWDEILKAYYSKTTSFDRVEFTNGYGSGRPKITFECKGIEIGKARHEWSDNWQGEVFIIKLGKII